MRILFDQGTPVPLRRVLADHEVATAFELGWHTLQNGELLQAAESAGFAALVTTDKNLRYQQNLTGRQLAILVLMTADWRRIQPQAESVARTVAMLVPGAYVELPFPAT